MGVGDCTICFSTKIPKWHPVMICLVVIFALVLLYKFIYWNETPGWFTIAVALLLVFTFFNHVLESIRDPHVGHYLLLTPKGLEWRSRGEEKAEVSWEAIREVSIDTHLKCAAIELDKAMPSEMKPLTLCNITPSDIGRILTFRSRTPPPEERRIEFDTPEGLSLDNFVAILRRCHEMRGTEWVRANSVNQ